MRGRGTVKKPKTQNENEPVAPPPPWIELPADVTANILKRLEYKDILENAEYVCTSWRRICFDPSMWRVLHIKDDDFWDELNIDLWDRAVQRSQGQLVDLTIEDFEDENVLEYIFDQSTQLKRLTIRCCCGDTLKYVVEALNKFSHLEELRLINSVEIKASDIEHIGKSCPVLKSFTIDQQILSYEPFVSHAYSHSIEYAAAIAKSMPNLCHLCLISILINNEGLEAILDGCTNLHSLDLRMCPELDLGGALGKRCFEQIKQLTISANALN